MRCLLFVVRCVLLFVVDWSCSLFVGCCVMFVVCCLLFADCGVLFVSKCCLWFVVCCLLCAVWNSLCFAC